MSNNLGYSIPSRLPSNYALPVQATFNNFNNVNQNHNLNNNRNVNVETNANVI